MGGPRVRRASAALTVEQRAALFAEGTRVGRVGMYFWDVPTRSVIWSDELFEILGLEPSDGEIDPSVFLDAAHPDDRVRVAAARDAARAGTMEPLEHRVVRPDGGVRFVRSTASTSCCPMS